MARSLRSTYRRMATVTRRRSAGGETRSSPSRTVSCDRRCLAAPSRQSDDARHLQDYRGGEGRFHPRGQLPSQDSLEDRIGPSSRGRIVRRPLPPRVHTSPPRSQARRQTDVRSVPSRPGGFWPRDRKRCVLADTEGDLGHPDTEISGRINRLNHFDGNDHPRTRPPLWTHPAPGTLPA